MKSQQRIARILSTALTAGLFLAPSLLGQNAQQNTNQPSTQQTPDTAQQSQQQTQPATTQPAQSSVPAQTQNQSAPATPAPSNAQPAAPSAQGQQTQQDQPAQQQQTQPAQPQQQNQPVNPPSGTTVNPSQAPLAPVTTYPDASGAQQQQQPSGTSPQANLPASPQPKQQQQQNEPLGAAAAERVPTAGGAAAKPAGVAIAPAKQHQTRSLLIKVGAALAAGAAVGTVFALSHSSPSTPPGSASPGVTQK